MQVSPVIPVKDLETRSLEAGVTRREKEGEFSFVSQDNPFTVKTPGFAIRSASLASNREEPLIRRLVRVAAAAGGESQELLATSNPPDDLQ